MSSIEFPPEDVALPCGQYPDLFIPSGYGQNNRYEVAAAKAICHSCPYRRECLRDALDKREPEGIRGGKTPAQRYHIRYPAKRAA